MIGLVTSKEIDSRVLKRELICAPYSKIEVIQQGGNENSPWLHHIDADEAIFFFSVLPGFRLRDGSKPSKEPERQMSVLLPTKSPDKEN